MLSESIERSVERDAHHLAGAIRSAAVTPDPSPHIVFANALPADTYAEVQAAYAASADRFTPQVHEGDPRVFFGSYAQRLEMRVPDATPSLPPEPAAVWTRLKTVLESDAVLGALVEVFRSGFEQRFGPVTDIGRLRPRLRATLLVTKHLPGYYLGPHTDRFEKVVTFILNCAEAPGLEHLGTSIYEPLEEGFTCRGIVHHDPAKFRLVETKPFAVNSAMVFFRDDRLFHGVERLTGEAAMGSERRNVQFNLWEQ